MFASLEMPDAVAKIRLYAKLNTSMRAEFLVKSLFDKMRKKYSTHDTINWQNTIEFTQCKAKHT